MLDWPTFSEPRIFSCVFFGFLIKLNCWTWWEGDVCMAKLCLFCTHFSIHFLTFNFCSMGWSRSLAQLISSQPFPLNVKKTIVIMHSTSHKSGAGDVILSEDSWGGNTAYSHPLTLTRTHPLNLNIVTRLNAKIFEIVLPFWVKNLVSY